MQVPKEMVMKENGKRLMIFEDCVYDEETVREAEMPRVNYVQYVIGLSVINTMILMKNVVPVAVWNVLRNHRFRQ